MYCCKVWFTDVVFEFDFINFRETLIVDREKHKHFINALAEVEKRLEIHKRTRNFNSSSLSRMTGG